VIHVVGLNLMRNTMVKTVFRYLYFVRIYKHLQVPYLAGILDTGRTFSMGRG